MCSGVALASEPCACGGPDKPFNDKPFNAPNSRMCFCILATGLSSPQGSVLAARRERLGMWDAYIDATWPDRSISSELSALGTSTVDPTLRITGCVEAGTTAPGITGGGAAQGGNRCACTTPTAAEAALARTPGSLATVARYPSHSWYSCAVLGCAGSGLGFTPSHGRHDSLCPEPGQARPSAVCPRGQGGSQVRELERLGHRESRRGQGREATSHHITSHHITHITGQGGHRRSSSGQGGHCGSCTGLHWGIRAGPPT